VSEINSDICSPVLAFVESKTREVTIRDFQPKTNISLLKRFQVVTAVSILVFWDVAPCGLVDT
jgi:hypothetical protein